MADQVPAPAASSRRRSPDARFTRRVIIAVIITLLALMLALLLWYGVRVLLVGFAGVLLAVLLRSIAMWISRVTRLSSTWSLVVTVLLIVALFVGLSWLLAARVVDQANQLVERLPAAAQRVKQQILEFRWGPQLLELVDHLNPASNAPAATTQIVQRATGFLSSTASVVIDALIIIFLGIYLALQPELYVDGLALLFPPSKRPRIRQVLNQCGQTLRWWLLAQGIDMIVIGATTALGLWMLKVPLALTLGVLAAAFNFIPNFGPIISYTPAVLLALVDSPEKALYVTILYIVLQNLEGHVLMPLLQRGVVDTPPALLVAFQVLLAMLVGVLGLALSAPLIACVVVIVKMLYVHDVLGDPVDLPTRYEPPRPGGPAL